MGRHQVQTQVFMDTEHSDAILNECKILNEYTIITYTQHGL